MSPEQKLRRGQAEAVRLIANQARVTIQLPVGYGKTLAAAAAYASLRSAGMVDRMLLIVPRTVQREQGAEGVPSDLREVFEIDARSWVIDDNDTATLLAHQKGTAEVFVIMVQRLTYPRGMAVVQRLLQKGNWLVVVDEHHHYAQDNGTAWTLNVINLPCRRMLAMSATPHRLDGLSTFGEPDFKVTYLEALDEGAVKPLELHAYDYRAEFVRVNGQVVSFTTAELLKLANGDVDKFIANREMRWLPDFVSPLIIYPAQRLNDHRTIGVRTQMLVIAMSVEHAKLVCEQIRSLLPGLNVDWCGTGLDGRPDDENREVLRRFCPPKNRLKGRREWTLDVLVSCNMAGEGLDSVDVTEVVFLNCPQITNTTLQAIGRGARVMPLQKQPICYINVDASSPLAAYERELVMDLFDNPDAPPKPRDPRTEPPDLHPLEPLPPFSLEVTKVELIDRTSHPAYRDVSVRTRRQAPADMSEEQFTRIVDKSFDEWWERFNAPLNETAVIKAKSEEIEARVRRLGHIAMRIHLASTPGASQKKGMLSQFCYRINDRKYRECGSIKKIASARELLPHAEFLQRLQDEINMQGLPSWLRF